MTESKAYRISQLEQLLEARAAVEAGPVKNVTSERQSVTVATFEGEPSATFEPKETPPEAPAHRKNGNGDAMPKSLEGMSNLTLRLLRIDGQMSKAEEAWYDRKTMHRTYSPFNPSPHDWMAF